MIFCAPNTRGSRIKEFFNSWNSQLSAIFLRTVAYLSRLTALLASWEKQIPFISCVPSRLTKIVELFQHFVDFDFIVFAVPGEGIINVQSFVADHSSQFVICPLLVKLFPILRRISFWQRQRIRWVKQLASHHFRQGGFDLREQQGTNVQNKIFHTRG